MTIMMTPVRTFAALASLLATGCPLVTVDAEIQSACSTRHDVAVDPAPADRTGPRAVQLDLELALDELQALLALDADIRFAHVRFEPTSGIADLAFIDAAHVVVASANPDSTLPSLTVADCAGDCPRDGIDLLLPAADGANVMDYVRAGHLVVDATFDGELPSVPWTLDITVCTRGVATTSAEL